MTLACPNVLWLKWLYFLHMCRKGFLHITLPYSFSLCKVRWIVKRCTSRSWSWSRCLELLCGLTDALTILHFSLSESFVGLPLQAFTITSISSLCSSQERLTAWISLLLFVSFSSESWCWTIFGVSSFESSFEAPCCYSSEQNKVKRILILGLKSSESWLSSPVFVGLSCSSTKHTLSPIVSAIFIQMNKNKMSIFMHRPIFVWVFISHFL